ncbi:MAG: hypothetical protein NTV54_08775 [Ignavibacteriales bacterium]|nr:hypothetical protein [Ignavibacteriales bacterium]
MERYRHTQTGYLLTYIILAATTAALVIVLLGRAPFPFWLLPIAAGAILFLFAALTVVVTDSSMLIKFGAGLIRRTIKLSNIACAVPCRTKAWYGWGIHWILPNTWVYNVSGFKAVELRMRSGRRILVGTDRPEELSKALWDAGIAREEKA